MGKESIEEIQKQIQEMTEAINGANAAMDQPPSNLYGKFMTHPNVKKDMELYEKITELSEEEKEFISSVIDLLKNFK